MNRTMMLILVDEDRAGEVMQLLEECHLAGFSEVPAVLGKGMTGTKLGSRAFPGSSTMYLAAVDEASRVPFTERLQSLHETFGSGVGFKVYAFNAEEVV